MGGALPEKSGSYKDMTSQQESLNSQTTGSGVENCWHAIWTRNNFEKIVHAELIKKGYEVFFPTIYERSSAKNSKKIIKVPMFKGYLFVRHEMDKHAYLDVCKTNGVVSLLGLRWDRLAKVPDEEIGSIRLVSQSQLPSMPYPYVKEGDRVRVRSGALSNAEGILVQSDEHKGLLVISVNLLRRSIAIKLNSVDVDPV